jgi:hypothetical protein
MATPQIGQWRMRGREVAVNVRSGDVAAKRQHRQLPSSELDLDQCGSTSRQTARRAPDAVARPRRLRSTLDMI